MFTSYSDEIDDYLMQYISTLIRAENRRSLSAGPVSETAGGLPGAGKGHTEINPAGPQSSAALDAPGSLDLRDETLESLEPSFRDSNATVVLRNIRRLLEAERVARATENGGNLRLLARLIHDPNDEVPIKFW
jgi:hypothetical protein